MKVLKSGRKKSPLSTTLTLRSVLGSLTTQMVNLGATKGARGYGIYYLFMEKVLLYVFKTI